MIDPSNSSAALTARQLEVEDLVKKGYSRKEIAAALKIAPNTVKRHIAAVLAKHGANNTSDLHEHFAPRSSRDKSLAGFWISRYDYKSYDPTSNDPFPYRIGVQINLESISEADGAFFNYSGWSIFSCSAGRSVYEHVFQLKQVETNVIGYWQNKTYINFANAGCMQLMAHNHFGIMRGQHLGISSNSAVNSGNWLWIKIEDGPPFNLDSAKLKSFQVLNALIDESITQDRPIYLTDVLTKKVLGD